MGNVHPQRMEEGLGQKKNKKIEALAYHKENTHKSFTLNKRNVPQLVMLGLVVPGVLTYASIFAFNDTTKGPLRYIQEAEPRLYGRGANKHEYYFPSRADLEREAADPRLRPHVYHPNPSDYTDEDKK